MAETKTLGREEVGQIYRGIREAALRVPNKNEGCRCDLPTCGKEIKTGELVITVYCYETAKKVSFCGKTFDCLYFALNGHAPKPVTVKLGMINFSRLSQLIEKYGRK